MQNGRKKTTVTRILCLSAIAANIPFILWIWYNRIKEGFKGTLPEKVSFIALTALLAVNTLLLIRCKRQ